MEYKNITVGLIRGRHEMPVDSYIFDGAIEDVHNYGDMDSHIFWWLQDNADVHITDFGRGLNQASDEDVRCFTGGKSLTVYVTGLTAVTASLIRVCALYGVHLTLKHYNNSTGDYESQPIF